MFAPTIGANLAVFDGGILFFAVLAIGDGLYRLDFKSATTQKVGAVCVPVPTIYELIVHNGGHFADLHDDFFDFGRFVFDGDVAHDVRDVKHYAQFVHINLLFVGFFCRFDCLFVFLLRGFFFGGFLAEQDSHAALECVRKNGFELVLTAHHS